ncbi:hypothetical protein MNBD_GAMMA10-2095, partial [hydrothermal vent metagenome]
GTNGQLLQGDINLTTGVYRTEIPENIYYALAVNDATLNAQKDRIGELADALNMSTAVDFFPQISAEAPVAPIDKRVAPEINKVSYFPCDDCVAPDQLVIEDCSGNCLTLVAAGTFECDMTLQLNIKDPKNRAFTVAGSILDGVQITPEISDRLVPLVDSIKPSDSRKVIFNLEYFVNIGPAIAKRNLSFDILNEFGFSQNFTVEADNLVPTGVDNEFSCGATITTIDNEVVGGI